MKVYCSQNLSLLMITELFLNESEVGVDVAGALTDACDCCTNGLIPKDIFERIPFFL